MGLAAVRRFVAEGARVVVGDLNIAAGEAVAAGLGDTVRFSRTDVADEGDVEALVGLAVEAFGGLDVGFNNAGIGGAFGPITELGEDAWDETFAGDVRSVFLGTEHAVRHMIEAGRRLHHRYRIRRRSRGRRRADRTLRRQGRSSPTCRSPRWLAPHRIRANAI
jgi:NAD(P)-dependent dehydrogenase (short-subunit alcohol dehydrogenase family)